MRGVYACARPLRRALFYLKQSCEVAWITPPSGVLADVALKPKQMIINFERDFGNVYFRWTQAGTLANSLDLCRYRIHSVHLMYTAERQSHLIALICIATMG